jgi:hypothetical protein
MDSVVRPGGLTGKQIPVECTARLEEQTKAANASLARIEERLGWEWIWIARMT